MWRRFKEVIKSAKGIPSFVGGAHFYLGSIPKRKGETEKARHHFEECLRFIPEHKKARESIDTFDKMPQNGIKEVKRKGDMCQCVFLTRLGRLDVKSITACLL